MKPAGTLVSSIVVMTWLLAGPASARMSPRQIYKTKANGVVLVVASPRGSSSASAGTGSIIRSDGTIVTNCHVIFNEQSKTPYDHLFVFLKPAKLTGDPKKDLKRRYEGKVVAYDRALDLALIRMTSPPSGLTVITLGDPDELGPGDETIAIGHPEQGGLWTITTGVIGTVFEDFKGVSGKHVFQMETSLNRGNSGGPLFDARGYQVGVNTSIARKGEGGVAITGVNFAVKSSVVKTWAAKHGVSIAYGKEPLVEEKTRVAGADKPAPRRPPEPVPPPPPDRSGDKKVYRDPASGGTITVEDDGEDDGEAVAPDRIPDTEKTSRPVVRKERPERKPVRFKQRYQTRKRPYTFKKLFTAVDEIRGRAKKGFDDLDREGKRRGR